MAITLKLTQSKAPGIWGAIGSVDEPDQHLKGDVKVLLKEVDKNKLVLHLDSSVEKSTIINREVLLYTAAEPVAVEKIQPGAEVTLSKFWFTLKKNKKQW